MIAAPFGVSFPYPNVQSGQCDDTPHGAAQFKGYTPAATVNPLTFASSAKGTVGIESITIQDVRGVNAVKLLEALKAAISPHYSVDKAVAPVVRDNTITVSLEPQNFGEVLIRHYIIADIQSDANRVAIRVASLAFDREGRLLPTLVNQTEPDRVLTELQKGLATKRSR